MNWGRDKGQDEPVEISRDESIESSGDIVYQILHKFKDV